MTTREKFSLECLFVPAMVFVFMSIVTVWWFALIIAYFVWYMLTHPA